MQSCSNIVSLLLIFVVLGIVHGDPEPMARPTRPKVFTSPEELRRYLDLVRDYYSLNGKARYGKRGDVSFPTLDESHPWDALRTILDVRRQIQQRKLEKGKQEKDEMLRDTDTLDVGKHSRRNGPESSYVLDIVRKYYDDVQ